MDLYETADGVMQTCKKISDFINLCKAAVNDADNPPSRVSIIGGPSVIISEVTPTTLRVLPYVRSMEFSPKELQTNFSICKFWAPPPNQGVPCAAGSAVSLSTPICHLCSRRQLRASVVLSSIYERRLQQAYTAFVKLFLEAEVPESVTTCFVLHCSFLPTRISESLRSIFDSHLACCFAAL
jgi:hypothetical protein